MSISFDTIPLDIRTFGQFIEFNNSRAVQGTPAQPHVALLIGQMEPTGGTASEGDVKLISSADAAEGYWGAGSIIAEMARAFKKANPSTELWGIALTDAGGSAANTKTIVVSGTATADGVIHLYLAGRYIPVTVSSGDLSTAVATAINAAILAHADYKRMSHTTDVSSSTVTLTARCKGTLSQKVDLRVNDLPGQNLPAGISLAITQAAVAGSGDPDLTTAITAMGDVQYHTIAMCSNVDADIEEMCDELEDRWGPTQQKEGHLFVGGVGTQGTLTTAGNGLNRPWATYVGAGGALASDGMRPPFWAVAAMVAGIDAYETQIDPARPRQTLALKGMRGPSPSSRFTQTERNTLLTDGISTLYTDEAGTVRIERLITTYQTNALSIPDPSYLDVTTMRNLAYLRYSVRSRIALKFPRHKLADDGTLFDPGQAIVTPSSIRAELISLFREWEREGRVENFEQFKDDLIVERDESDRNRVNMRMSPDLINQFIVFAGQIQFLL